MGDVVVLDVETTLNLPPERVLEAAKCVLDDSVLVLGYDRDGSLYISSSTGDKARLLWMLEQAKISLLMPEEAGGMAL